MEPFEMNVVDNGQWIQMANVSSLVYFLFAVLFNALTLFSLSLPSKIDYIVGLLFFPTPPLSYLFLWNCFCCNGYALFQCLAIFASLVALCLEHFSLFWIISAVFQYFCLHIVRHIVQIWQCILKFVPHLVRLAFLI